MILPQLEARLNEMVKDHTISKPTLTRFRKTYEIMERLYGPISQDEANLDSEAIALRAMLAAHVLVK